MRVKHFTPPPPVQYQTTAKNGPETLGAQQASYLQRLQKFRQGRYARNEGGRKKKRSETGIFSAELVTEFDEAMCTAYDKLLGRQEQKSEDQEKQADNAASKDFFRVKPTIFRA